MARLTLDQAAVYIIQVQAVLQQKYSLPVESMEITVDEASNVTTLTCTVADQAALHGVFNRLRDMCLPILSVVYEETRSEEG